MKGFPNQISDLKKLSAAMKVIMELLAQGKNPRRDEVLGEALVRAGVAGTGHVPMPVEEYLAKQRLKAPSNRSFQTTARGLRELFRILGFIDDSGDGVVATLHGRRIAAYAGEDLTPEHLDLWRRVIRSISHGGADGESSHPYQVLLRLIAKRPGITRSKCALALEARNDSEEELTRIVALADMDEDEIPDAIGETKTNWDNAKKILPRFAEQLEDVQKVGQHLFISDAPGIPKESPAAVEGIKKGPRKPRSSSKVTVNTIAKIATTEEFDEADESIEVELDIEAIKARKAKMANRLRRHNSIVREVATFLENEGAELYENPFDCLACFDEIGLLVEVKSLDGTKADERNRVRDALAQLLYYESFVTHPLVKERAVQKVACFESKVSDEHIKWLMDSDIQVIWRAREGFTGDAVSREHLAGHFGF